MDFQFWNLNNASSAFGTLPKGSFPSNVSAYFRRPSKVVKSSSRNNSPRTSTRRRMTTTGHASATTRTRSVVDYQRMSMPQLSDARFNHTSRPISWHPNMLEDMGQFQTLEQATSESFLTTPYTAAEVNGLVTPMSYPLMDEPQIQELITPLEGLSADEATGQYSYGQDLDMTHYWLAQQNKDSTSTVNQFEPSMYHMMNYGTWYDHNQYMASTMHTAPTSPSYLPMPEFGAPLELPAPQADEDSEELIAMGLYDSPADVQSSSLLFGGPAPARKSLKLEDAFEPSPNSDDEEDDGEEAEDDDEVTDEAAISPSIIQDQTHTTHPDSVPAQYAQTMDNSYMMNQWHAPAQNAYGFF